MQIRSKFKHRAPRQSGFTLIEILVTVIILAIGLLGLGSLQVNALRNDHSAFMRTQATMLAYDIADRMRANLPAVAAGFYNPANAATVGSCNTTAGCTGQQMAQNDLQEWLASIGTYLPAGTAWVCLDSTPNDGTGPGAAACDGAGTTLAIKVWWDDERDGTTHLFATSLQP